MSVHRSVSVMLTPEQQLALVADAARAPSVYNTQPARWRFTAADDDIVLLRALNRELPVRDPEGLELVVTLGAAWEGMAIALTRLGIALGAPVGERVADDEGRESYARGRLRAGAARDPLASVVHQRHTHRAPFLTPTPESRAQLATLAAPDLLVVDAPAAIADVAERYERARRQREAERAYHAERWSWLRLRRADPRWMRDGLTADALALSSAQRVLARIALSPLLHPLLARAGVTRALGDERAMVRGATGLLLFAPRRDLAPFDVGRRFYRLWLELTAAGLHAAPMSAASEVAAVRDVLADRFDIPPDRRLAYLLRVGVATEVVESARLPVGELTV